MDSLIQTTTTFGGEERPNQAGTPGSQRPRLSWWRGRQGGGGIEFSSKVFYFDEV